jgi:hypothetical protein
LKIVVELKDPSKCNDCPCIDSEFYPMKCNYFNIKLRFGKDGINRPKMCIKKNGL